MKRICLLGASRGLGWATYKSIQKKYPDSEVLLVSRKIENKRSEIRPRDQVFTFDFAKAEASPGLPRLVSTVQAFQPDSLIYFAGGGPYGPFEAHSWKDHLWSLKVSFLFPAEFLHACLRSYESGDLNGLQSITLIGSSIAENNADPQAASYAAAKHALHGLIRTVQLERQSLPKIKLFSPGYMVTDLLPVNSAPRLKGLAQQPEVIAEQLLNFVESPSIRWVSTGD